MFIVLLELTPIPGKQQHYFNVAKELHASLQSVEGFISVERFQSLAMPEKYLSVSFWENEDAIQQWRNFGPHLDAQKLARSELFNNYRISVAEITRQYAFCAP
jgi:heme-degrading monooxygenase HmoA